MTLNKLASQIAFREGKKKQEHIANIRESLKIMIDLEAEGILAEMKAPGVSAPRESIALFIIDKAAKIVEKQMKKVKKC